MEFVYMPVHLWLHIMEHTTQLESTVLSVTKQAQHACMWITNGSWRLCMKDLWICMCASFCVRVCACYMLVCAICTQKKYCNKQQMNSFCVCVHANGGICMHICLFACMYAYAYACGRCGVHYKNLKVCAHSHARTNKMQAHCWLCSPCVLFCRLCGSTDPIGFPRLLGSGPCRSSAKLPAPFLPLLVAAAAPRCSETMGAATLGLAAAACATFLACGVMHIVNPFLRGLNQGLLASRKQQNSTDQDGSGQLTLMFACFCLSYHAQQAFSNGQGSLIPSQSPFANFFSSLRSFRNPYSTARLCLENG